MPMKNPPHPGDFIRTEIIGPAGLSGGMALRIEKAFGVKMDTLMRMQASYDIAQTRKREREIRVRRFHPPAEVRP